MPKGCQRIAHTSPWYRNLLVFLPACLAVAALFGQPYLSGTPFIRNYPPEEYGAHNQNWAIVQDQRGVMYFGNTHGIMEYDGVSWRLIPRKDKDQSLVRSLALGEDGRIYVGGVGDMGYLGPNAAQQLQFVSLLPQIEDSYRDFADVWQTLAVGRDVYFVAQKYVFRWNGRQMRGWKAQTSFHVGFEVNGRFYVRQREIGLMQILADSLEMAPLGEQFANELIYAILPFPAGGKNQLLLATRGNGLLRYDGRSIERFPTEADALLAEAQVYCGARLAGGHYAFGTLQDGVVVIDEAGRLRQHLNKATGLQDETIWYLYPDRQGALWLGMHIGISRAETDSPHTFFGEREGVEGSILQIVRHQGRLYVATSMGVYYLDENPLPPRAYGRFHRIPGVSPQCWALLPVGKSLLAGAFDGVYEIRNGQGRKLDPAYAMALSRSRQDSNRVFVGMQNGLKTLYLDNGAWRDEGRIEGIDLEIRHMLEIPDGQLWLSTFYHGLMLADFSRGFTRQPSLLRFDTLHGLPAMKRSVAFSSSRGVRFATLRGVFRFDAQLQRFFPDSALVKGLTNNQADLFTVSEDRRGNLWMVGNEKSRSGLALRQADGTYQWQESPFLRFAGLHTYYAYPDPLQDGVTWLGCLDRVIRYDGTVPQDDARGWRTLIRQVTAHGDSLLYGGALPGPAGMVTLKYTDNALRFHFAAPAFGDESKTQYQYRLEGYDDNWSNWSAETYKDYTSLPPGTYRFWARSKNGYRQIGEPAVYAFEILPPFYRTTWAWLLYALLIAGGVFGLWQYQVKRIRKMHLREMKQLEYEKLKELDQLKSRFFANISHEFRTPLTLILGPVDHLLSTQPETEQARQYHLIRRNARRLLRLINQLLDLSKLEAGRMKLALAYENIIPLLRAIVLAFESLVQSKNIRLHFVSERQSVFLDFDRDKMEQIFTNLVSNAVKFTPEGGAVQIEAKMTDGGGWLQIDVADNGPGITPTDLPHVFNRFYQSNEASRGEEPGTGIGLALTKELVELHQGRISVSSVEGEGARFRILLPVGKDQPVPTAARPAGIRELTFRPEETALERQPLAAAAEAPAPETTLLLVEDNADMRAFLRETLGGIYRVLEAADGQDGVEKALEQIPDLIISDVMMPRKDGLQLCDLLKNDERTSHIPIILLTARADIESRLAGLERGADDYLAKPFHREELLIRTRNLLAGRERLRARYASLPPLAPAADKSVQIEDAFLEKIRTIVEQHLSDSTFEIDQLARQVGMSRSQLFRKVKALTGQSPSLFIRAIRLRRGKELLETTGMNVSEVAYTVGFSTPAYFSDVFAETYGIRPSQL